MDTNACCNLIRGVYEQILIKLFFLTELLKRIDLLGYTVKITEDAKDFIAEKGFDIKFGARPLKRAIQKYFEDPLSEEIINSKIKEGDTIKVSLNKEQTDLLMKITKPIKTEKVTKKIKKAD